MYLDSAKKKELFEKYGKSAERYKDHIWQAIFCYYEADVLVVNAFQNFIQFFDEQCLLDAFHFG